MALPTSLGQRALQSLNRPSALQFIGTPQMGAPATQPVPQNIMGLRQKVLEQQMRPQMTPAQQFAQMTAGLPAMERTPAPDRPKGLGGLLSGMIPEAGTPEMAGIGAAGQKLLELSGYRQVPITTAEALGQAAGAFTQARGAALQQQREEAAAQAAAERQRQQDIFERDKFQLEFGLKKQKEAREAAKPPQLATLYDESTGREYKARWDAEQGSYVRVGGMKAGQATNDKPLSPAGKHAHDMGFVMGTPEFVEAVENYNTKMNAVKPEALTALQKEAKQIYPDDKEKQNEYILDARQRLAGVPKRDGIALNENNQRVGRTVFDPKTSSFSVVDDATGETRPLRVGERTIAASDKRDYMISADAHHKRRAELRKEKISVRKLVSYAESIAKTKQGVGRLADQFLARAKTFLATGNKGQPLTTSQINTLLAEGKLQGLLGAFRIETVGGGVMTEQDALRVIRRLGGDVNSLQSKQEVEIVLQEILEDKLANYNDEALVYNEQQSLRGVKDESQFIKPINIDLSSIFEQAEIPQDVSEDVSDITYTEDELNNALNKYN